MSANSPTLSPSQAETTSPPNSRDDSSEQHDDAPTSISPLVTGDDTTDHHPVPEPPQQQQTQQQQQGASSSSPTIPSTARTEIVDSSESVVESLQRPVVNVAPVASVAQTPTTATATPVDNIVPPATTAPAMRELTPSPEMRKPSSPPSIGPSGAALSITLLLISGVRHQFTMDETYLEQHSVKTQSGKEPLKDPFEMSVGQLKECIWKDWKDEWDQKPASAMFIRLIHFGRMLEDKHPLKECRLNQDTPNVVHMTVRPPEVGDDEMTQRSTKGGLGHTRDNGSGGSTPSCRCVIL